MGAIVLFFETKTGKYLKNLIIGVGAGVVLMGALFKIMHWPGASDMLTAGMLTEAFIFCLLGILPPHKDYYWERYYPNLDENPHVEAYRKGTKFQTPAAVSLTGGGSGNSATANLDKMLDEANINAPNLKRLNDNFQRFGQTVEQMKDITDVTAATGTYSQSAREAADALGKMKDTFVGATNTLSSFNNAAESTATFHQQVQVLSKNLGSLNQIYEVELQDANNHLKAMNKFYSNLVNASDAMASSASDAVSAKEQIATLSKNLTQLNSIYGNMLSAMQGR
jgi:gliding motility-associated protein GldL